MNITAVRSDEIYTKMIYEDNKEKENIYRYELIKLIHCLPPVW